MDQVTLETALLELGRAGHAAHALYVASNLERSLEELIALRMPNLSNTLNKQLFTGYGPLSSFSAKIDIAFALDLIPANLRRDLHAIRYIRTTLHTLQSASTSILLKWSTFSKNLPTMRQVVTASPFISQNWTPVTPS